MALDLIKNDNTLLWFLQNDLQRVYQKIVYDSEQGKSGLATQKSVEEVMQDAAELAEAIQRAGVTIDTLSGDYASLLTRVSQTESDIGGVTESVTTLETGTAEQFRVQSERVTSVETNLANYQTKVDGEILRGFIQYNGEEHWGIAIGRKLTFDATVTPTTHDNATYYALAGEKTFGLYTSTGWELFIGGNLIAWCDSTVDNGALQIAKVSATETLVVGEWEYVTDKTNHTLGIRYIGS